jgi:hypothetical protein
MLKNVKIKKDLQNCLQTKKYAYHCTIKQHTQTPHTMNTAVNTSNFSDTYEIKFAKVPTMPNGFMDVIYKGQRIAIINGLSAPLQWTAKNGSNIPVRIIEKIEKLVKRNLN